MRRRRHAAGRAAVRDGWLPRGRRCPAAEGIDGRASSAGDGGSDGAGSRPSCPRPHGDATLVKTDLGTPCWKATTPTPAARGSRAARCRCLRPGAGRDIRRHRAAGGALHAAESRQWPRADAGATAALNRPRRHPDLVRIHRRRRPGHDGAGTLVLTTNRRGGTGRGRALVGHAAGFGDGDIRGTTHFCALTSTRRRARRCLPVQATSSRKAKAAWPDRQQRRLHRHDHGVRRAAGSTARSAAASRCRTAPRSAAPARSATPRQAGATAPGN